MKKLRLIHCLLIIILLYGCSKKNIRGISGFYERDYSNDHYTLELKKNKDFISLSLVWLYTRTVSDGIHYQGSASS